MTYYAVFRKDDGDLRSLGTTVPGVDGEPGNLSPNFDYVDIGGPQAGRIWDPITRTMGVAPPPITEDDKIAAAGAEFSEWGDLNPAELTLAVAIVKMLRRLS
jgi:hypothetical protein